MAGYRFLPPRRLRQVLRDLAIEAPQLDRTLGVLSRPDPAGVVPTPTREQVAHVAAYLHRRVLGVRSQSPHWVLIERGHPAAQAVWWHEFQQLEDYRLLGVRNPLEAGYDSPAYWRAHARAAWEEAAYWERWAAADGEGILARTFLQANPLRDAEEVERILGVLVDTWAIDVEPSAVLESRRAEQFYRVKEFTERDVERWLRS